MTLKNIFVMRANFIAWSALAAFATTSSLIHCGVAPDDGSASVRSDVIETFESAHKSSYTAGTVTLPTGDWLFDDALVGTLASDAKDGARAARIEHTGSITLMTSRANGLGTLTLRHGSYALEPSATWNLMVSTDDGATWTQVGDTMTTASPALSTASFDVNLAGNVRIAIKKLSGGRLDLDDISFTGFGATSVHLAMGTPTSPRFTGNDDYLLVKPQYALGYNDSRREANWVSWRLALSNLGSTPRYTGNFLTETALPPGFHLAAHHSYDNTGFSRGHMCPSDERTDTPVDNVATFTMSNVLPQYQTLNGGPWEQLESYCKSLVSDQHKALYIVAGGIYASAPQTIGPDALPIPTSTWKVVVVLEEGQGLADVGPATRVIAVNMPNSNVPGFASTAWETYRVAVDDIQAASTFDLLPAIPDVIENVIEARIDTE